MNQHTDLHPETAEDESLHISTKASILEEEGDYEGAAEMHKRAVAENEDDPNAHAGLISHFVRCHLSQLIEDPDAYALVAESIDVLQSQDSSEDVLDQLWLEIAVFYSQISGDAENATKAFQKAIETNPSVDTYYNYANYLDQALGNATLAEEMYNHCLALAPDHVLSLNNYAALLIERARNLQGEQATQTREKAVQLLLQAQELSPGYPAYNLACAYALNRNESECKRWLQVTVSQKIVDADDIVGDDDLASVRGCSWFKPVVAGTLLAIPVEEDINMTDTREKLGTISLEDSTPKGEVAPNQVEKVEQSGPSPDQFVPIQ